MKDNSNDTSDVSMVNKSKLFLKSVGYASKNLELNSKILEVYPAEEFGYVDGEITDEREVIEETGVDAKGNVYSDKIETSNSLMAEWLPLGSNRATAPNVRRGERVFLLQYADDDKYYWVTAGLDPHLRRRETVVFNISNTVDESVTELTSENTYSLIFSTHTKEITLQTSKSDGEPFEYIIKLDTEEGVFVVTDDIDNQISLESAERRITLVNSDDSKLVLDKKNILMQSDDVIDIKSKTVNITSDNTNVKSTAVKVSTTTYGLSATTATVSAGKYSMSGGSITLGGSGLVVNSGSKFNGTITNNGVNIGSTHTHGGVKSGGSNTSPPN